MTPLEKTEALYLELVQWYADGDERELRAASKLLMVALDRLRAHGGGNWPSLVYEYVSILSTEPERFARMLEAQRGESRQVSGARPGEEKPQ